MRLKVALVALVLVAWALFFGGVAAALRLSGESPVVLGMVATAIILGPFLYRNVPMGIVHGCTRSVASAQRAIVPAVEHFVTRGRFSASAAKHGR